MGAPVAADLVLAAAGEVNNGHAVGAYDIDGFENGAAEVGARYNLALNGATYEPCW
jgi:hypothetical protein